VHHAILLKYYYWFDNYSCKSPELARFICAVQEVVEEEACFHGALGEVEACSHTVVGVVLAEAVVADRSGLEEHWAQEVDNSPLAEEEGVEEGHSVQWEGEAYEMVDENLRKAVLVADEILPTAVLVVDKSLPTAVLVVADKILLTAVLVVVLAAALMILQKVDRAVAAAPSVDLPAATADRVASAAGRDEVARASEDGPCGVAAVAGEDTFHLGGLEELVEPLNQVDLEVLGRIMLDLAQEVEDHHHQDRQDC
jgi:hypothetical protein